MSDDLVQLQFLSSVCRSLSLQTPKVCLPYCAISFSQLARYAVKNAKNRFKTCISIFAVVTRVCLVTTETKRKHKDNKAFVRTHIKQIYWNKSSKKPVRNNLTRYRFFHHRHNKSMSAQFKFNQHSFEIRAISGIMSSIVQKFTVTDAREYS